MRNTLGQLLASLSGPDTSKCKTHAHAPFREKSTFLSSRPHVMALPADLIDRSWHCGILKELWHVRICDLSDLKALPLRLLLGGFGHAFPRPSPLDRLDALSPQLGIKSIPIVGQLHAAPPEIAIQIPDAFTCPHRQLRPLDLSRQSVKRMKS